MTLSRQHCIVFSLTFLCTLTKFIYSYIEQIFTQRFSFYAPACTVYK